MMIYTPCSADLGKVVDGAELESPTVIIHLATVVTSARVVERGGELLEELTAAIVHVALRYCAKK